MVREALTRSRGNPLNMAAREQGAVCIDMAWDIENQLQHSERCTRSLISYVFTAIDSKSNQRNQSVAG